MKFSILVCSYVSKIYGGERCQTSAETVIDYLREKRAQDVELPHQKSDVAKDLVNAIREIKKT